MDTDDIAPPPKQGKPASLDTLSIFELEARIKDLEAEIQRTREAIARKSGAKTAADSFFKKA